MSHEAKPKFEPLDIPKPPEVDIPEADVPTPGAGRPTVMTDLVLRKLVEVFAYDCTDEEACYYAGIAVSTLYYYQQKHPEFVEYKQALKEKPVLLARKSVIGAFATDPKIALSYLELKRRKEFSKRTEQDNTNSEQEEILAQIKSTLKVVTSKYKQDVGNAGEEKQNESQPAITAPISAESNIASPGGEATVIDKPAIESESGNGDNILAATGNTAGGSDPSGQDAPNVSGGGQAGEHSVDAGAEGDILGAGIPTPKQDTDRELHAVREEPDRRPSVHYN